MGSGMTYLDFAENDYMFFKAAYDNGLRMNTMASIGQNACEKYLKHIISEYANPENHQEREAKNDILRAHSLQKLMKYIKNDMHMSIPEDTQTKLAVVNCYYYNTRYPGDDSFLATSEDIEDVNKAIEVARDFTLETCRQYSLAHEALYDYYDYDDFDSHDSN